MRQTRVLHLIKSLGRGGAESLLPEMLRFADRERYEYLYAYFLPWKDAMVGALREEGVAVHCLPARGSLGVLARSVGLARALRGWKVDLVHAHLPMAGVAGRFAGRWAGVPVVYSEHNTQERYHPLTRRLNRATWGMQERVIAVSGEVAESARRSIGARVPVQVVPNGVDVERFRRDSGAARGILRQLGIPDGAPIVGSVAVFRPQKALGLWLETARATLQAVPEAHFILVGDGPERAGVEAQITASGLEGRVHLPGLQSDVLPWLSAMDVYLMTSRFEGLPVALLEAMSAGCVPVCTAVGGIPEVLRGGHAGVLVDGTDADELAAHVATLLLQVPRREGMAQDARQTVRSRFGIDRMVREVESVYSSVLEAWELGRPGVR